MKLLLIEDDQALVRLLRRGLRQLYRVVAVGTAAEGIKEAEYNDYDLIILDLHLPDGNGRQVCERLRVGKIIAPILILTGEDEAASKVELLDAGAEDYLTKPFNLEELKARLRVLTRRQQPVSRTSLLKVGDLTMDTANRIVARAGQTIKLSRKDYDLLEYLMRHAGMVVTRTMILDHVWESNEDLWTNTVDVHIKYLRDRIDRPFNPRLLKTVYGVGYKLERPLTPAVAPPL